MSAPKDCRETAVLAKYSTTLLLAELLDRAMDRDQLEIFRLEDCIEKRAKLEQENNQKKGAK